MDLAYLAPLFLSLIPRPMMRWALRLLAVRGELSGVDAADVATIIVQQRGA